MVDSLVVTHPVNTVYGVRVFRREVLEQRVLFAPTGDIVDFRLGLTAAACFRRAGEGVQSFSPQVRVEVERWGDVGWQGTLCRRVRGGHVRHGWSCARWALGDARVLSSRCQVLRGGQEDGVAGFEPAGGGLAFLAVVVCWLCYVVSVARWDADSRWQRSSR